MTTSKFRIPYLRWWIVGLLFLASMLNYIDRQTLAQLKATIQEKLRFDDLAYGNIASAFLLAYGVAYLLSGRITDWLGTRLSMVVYITWWSIANMLHALATSATSLGFFRVLLGLGEAGNYIVGPKVVSEWFPARERALAIGIYTLGAAIGAAVAPPLIIFLKNAWGWQAAFVLTGAMGALWIVPWLLLYRRPSDHPRITDTERDLILREQAAALAETPDGEAKLTEGQRWLAVIRRTDVWGLTLARLITDPLWYFYLFWLVAYLQKNRGLSEDQTKIVWVVFVAADIGILLGGWFSGWMIRRGAAPAASRMRTMMFCAMLIPLSPLGHYVGSLWLALGVMMATVLAHQGWLTNLSALVVDRVPRNILGTAFGIVAAGSTFGGMLMNEVVKRLAKADQYDKWFIVMACLHPVAWVLLYAIGAGRTPKSPMGSRGIDAVPLTLAGEGKVPG